ncbi:MAG: HAD family hydrolase [Thermoleophilia bacterium]|nr:HAD family hydrolase [Thermoleophilia bacterium]
MIDAVLFDWGDTLFHFRYDEELLEAGWAAGLAAAGRDRLPAPDEAAAHFRDSYLPLVLEPGTLEEVEYPGIVRRVLARFGVEIDDEALARFLEAEHEAWVPARRMGAESHALLDSLRERGLRVGLVSNAFDPGWLLRRDLERMGLAERLETAVFSSEVGVRKPHPRIFETALVALDTPAERTLFVGDSRYADIRGAGELGMRTAQALWFRVDGDERGADPDFQAFTPMDVLDIARRLIGEA